MDWLQSLRGAIDYMEAHMLDPVTPADVAKAVNLSPFYLQKGFQIVTGYSLSEYVRSRRLYLAALDLLAGEEKIIDVAYKYCYQTPESFTKAFTRFHGFPPSQVKRRRIDIKPFVPLKIKVSVQGGKTVDFIVEKKGSFQMIGFKKEIPMDRGYELCPKFWEEISAQHLDRLWQGKRAETELDRAIVQCSVGMFGVCIDNQEKPDTFTYMIAGPYYDGRTVPEGLDVVEIPAASWAMFRSIGPLSDTFHTLNTQIFQEWLPGNNEYDLAFPINLEYYAPGEAGTDYEIWIPVTEKKNAAQ